MKEGDYLFTCENDSRPKILVERKSVGDLYSSIMGSTSKGKPSRLTSQVSRLTTHQTDSVVILLITGSVEEYVVTMKKFGKSVDPDLIDGTIASLLTRDNIRIIWNYHEKTGLKQMVRTAIKICEGSMDVPSLRNLDTLTARLLNITLVQWKNIREIYGTDLTYIATLKVNDLMKVDGIGKIKAQRIKEMLTGKSNDWLK